MHEFAVGPDEERGARHACYGFSVHRFVAEQIEPLDEDLISVSEERVLDFVFFCELLLRADGVARDTQDHSAGLLELYKLIAKAAGFDRAAGRVGARIEKEDDW